MLKYKIQKDRLKQFGKLVGEGAFEEGSRGETNTVRVVGGERRSCERGIPSGRKKVLLLGWGPARTGL